MPLATMGLLTGSRAPAQVLGQVPRRAFSYPDHIVMEMPNLSPTMEKVLLRRHDSKPLIANFSSFFSV